MKEEIEECIKVLNAGGVILYPTDTVWGLGCDAANEDAVKKIYAIKRREDAKSLITLVGSDGMLQKYVEEVPDLAWDIIDLATKPTTIIYPKAKNMAPNVIAENGSIGIRMVKEGFCHQLVNKYNKAIVSTSANISGNPTPKDFSEISSEIIEGVDFTVNANLEKGSTVPSSIIKLAINGEIEVIRE